LESRCLTGKVIAICKSDKRGVKNERLAEGLFKENYGLVGDAHASSETWREVSILGVESIRRKQNLIPQANPGDNAENLLTEGVDWTSLPVSTKVFVGEEVILEITEIGKKEHPEGYAVLPQGRISILPGEGVFARVIRGGSVRNRDIIKVLKE
jgi:MOSC domain-containing protein YiiM